MQEAQRSFQGDGGSPLPFPMSQEDWANIQGADMEFPSAREFNELDDFLNHDFSDIGTAQLVEPPAHGRGTELPEDVPPWRRRGTTHAPEPIAVFPAPDLTAGLSQNR